MAAAAAKPAKSEEGFNWTLAVLVALTVLIMQLFYLSLVMNTSPGFVADFREAAPYIHYLRGKTLVIGITDSLLEGDTLNRLAADFHLLVWACASCWYMARAIFSTASPPTDNSFRNTTATAALPTMPPCATPSRQSA